MKKLKLCIIIIIIIIIIKEVKSRNKNLAMAWIDYKKAYDVVLHPWIIEYLDLFGVAVKLKLSEVFFKKILYPL